MEVQRILLKLSGEMLAGAQGFGIDVQVIKDIGHMLRGIRDQGIEVAVVIGGGNFFRGIEFDALNRAQADAMGMLATAMNALALEDLWNGMLLSTRAYSSLGIRGQLAVFDRKQVLRDLRDSVVVLAGGTGSPYFSTDTAAVLRGAELSVDLVLKATKVDGIYTDDPEENPEAKYIQDMTYDEILIRGLRVMDWTAVSLAKEAQLPLVVFNLYPLDNLEKILRGEKIGTWVHP